MTEPRYKSTLNGQRAADAELVEKFRETAAKFSQDQKVILTLLNDLSMSTKQEDKAILPLVQILFQNFSRTEDLGNIFNLQARICQDIVNVIYIHLNDVDKRVHRIEEKHTSRYFWSKARWLGATIQFAASTAAAILILWNFKIPGVTE